MTEIFGAYSDSANDRLVMTASADGVNFSVESPKNRTGITVPAKIVVHAARKALQELMNVPRAGGKRDYCTANVQDAINLLTVEIAEQEQRERDAVENAKMFPVAEAMFRSFHEEFGHVGSFNENQQERWLKIAKAGRDAMGGVTS